MKESEQKQLKNQFAHVQKCDVFMTKHISMASKHDQKTPAGWGYSTNKDEAQPKFTWSDNWLVAIMTTDQTDNISCNGGSQNSWQSEQDC